MRVLVACEFSGRVRDAFLKRGHDAVSCDLLPTDSPGPHVQGNVLDILCDGWDLMVGHPPCTHLASSGAAHFERKGPAVQKAALDFFAALYFAPIGRVCIENPVGIPSTRFGKPTQIVQPWWFGDAERKATCLWLRGLPPLKPTRRVKPEIIVYPNGKTYSKCHNHYVKTGKPRGYERSRTFIGFAEAMADQWSALSPIQPRYSVERWQEHYGHLVS